MIRVVKKAIERRSEIVAASRDLFLHQGYENTTMQDVISKLHIAKGTVYHYFSSKEALLEAVVEEMASHYISEVGKALKKCRGNALKKMRVLVTAGDVSPTHSDTLENLHSTGNIGMHTRLLAVTIAKLAPLYAKVIAEGCQEGFFQVEYPLESAEMLLAGAQFITDVGCYPWQQQDIKRRMRALPSLMESLLNADKGSLKFLFK